MKGKMEELIMVKRDLKKWEHWDLNPDLRVSSRFIVPVNHHESDDPVLIKT